MEYRDIKFCLKSLFNLKASGCGYVLKVDTAKSGSHPLHSLDDLFGILCIKADGNSVDTTELLEQNCLSFHNGHCCFRADIAEPQDSASVGNDSNGVSLPCVLIYEFLVICYLSAGLGNSGSVGDSQCLS